MINREITYERSVSKSYMKIPACVDNSFDEKLMLKKEIAHTLSVEKCYINGIGQYWYNITGKQALDSFLRVKELGISFIEKLLLNICSQMEQLEWNLLDMNCLVLEPEFIFITNGSQEIDFTLYPDNKGNVFEELSKLMEYLLTKLDHKDSMAVRCAYGLYELTLTEGYSLSDIKEFIKAGREKEDNTETVSNPIFSAKETIPKVVDEHIQHAPKKQSKFTVVEEYKEKMKKTWNQALEIFHTKAHREKEQEAPLVVYPELLQNPTVCLVNTDPSSRGMLIHEGMGCYPDCEFGECGCQIGNNPKADLFIEKNTISCFHANIEYIEGQYYIEDLNSTNGTFVNEAPVNYKQKKRLSSGDILRFADVKYRFF